MVFQWCWENSPTDKPGQSRFGTLSDLYNAKPEAIYTAVLMLAAA
jgi:hypothetical protein